MAAGRAPILTPRGDDFPRWYQDVLNKAELADNGPVRGTMVIRPYAYAMWERMVAEVDARIKAAGAENAYFPLFIPESYLQREAEHVEGFSPELAVVTIGGGKELEEPVVVRPTSETVIGEYMAKWVQSYRDLPLLLNQWANVVRWELRPRVFLRTSEFLWQEGHTAHATEDDARRYAEHILRTVYRDFMVEVLAIPVLVGAKIAQERFAGATNTLTCEAMMGDGKALQMGTSHELGQNFARAFDVTFLDEHGEQRTCWTTSWGVSTRMMGGLIMAHGDDAGLRVPPRLAAVQAVVLVVRDEDGAVTAAAQDLVDALAHAGVRARLDARVETGFGRRATEWELKGVPLRIEVGPRDLAEGQVVVARRDDGTKSPVPVGELPSRVPELLEAVQLAMLAEATERRDAGTTVVGSVEAAAEAAATGFAVLPWRLLDDAAIDLLGRSAITVRCLQTPDGDLPGGTPADELVAVCARSY
jgi:prolyl-tRNA synthetase